MSASGSSISPPLQEIITPTEMLSDVTFSEEDIFDVFMKLNSNKAMGIDGISLRLLKYCAFLLYLPFHRLFHYVCARTI